MFARRAIAMFAHSARRLYGVALLSLTGCGTLFTQRGVPDDPLFLSRKPHEAKAVSTAPLVVVHAELTPPPNPYFADNRTVAGTLTRRSTTSPAAGEPHE